MTLRRKSLVLLALALTLPHLAFAQDSAEQGASSELAEKSAPAEQTASAAQPDSAQESSAPTAAQKRVPPRTMFLPMLTLFAAYAPNNDALDVKIPYCMPLVQGRFSHRFTEFGKNPELTFIANAEVAPLWLGIGSHIEAKPLPFLTLSAGGDFGTSWGFDLGFLALDFIGRYDGEKREYDYFSPFTHWVYDGWAQLGLKYDVGSLFTKGKQHFIFGASYRALYSGMTGVENGEIWMHQGSSLKTNGFSYEATANLTYQIPHTFFKNAGLNAKASGYYSESLFDEAYRKCDPTFTDLTFTFTASASIGYKNTFMLMLPVSSKRDFDCDKDLEPLTAPTGRKWVADGLILTFTHIF